MVNLWKVNLSPEAKKRLQKIPNPDRRRILTALDALYTGPSGDDSSSIYRFQGRRVQMIPPLQKRFVLLSRDRRAKENLLTEKSE